MCTHRVARSAMTGPVLQLGSVSVYNLSDESDHILRLPCAVVLCDCNKRACTTLLSAQVHLCVSGNLFERNAKATAN